MNILYYTKPFLLDCDLPLVRSLYNYHNVTLLIDLPRTLRNSTILNIKNDRLVDKSAILSAEAFPELMIYAKFFDSSKTFVINRKSNHAWNLSNIILNIKVVLFILRNKFNVIHTTVIYEALDFFLYLFWRKTILTVHDPFLHSGEETKKVKILRKVAFKLFRKFIILNNSQYEDFINRYKLKRKDVLLSKLGPYEVLTTVSSKCNLNIDYPYFLFFGRISLYKGVELLIEAMHDIQIQNPNVKLIIAGKGKINMAKEIYESAENIEFLNRFITIEELKYLIEHSQFTICPYLDATQSGVVMSSFALKKTIIATRVGGLPEMISENEGVLISPNNKQALVSAILNLFDNSHEIDRLSKGIENRYFKGNDGWNSISRELSNFYKSIHI